MTADEFRQIALALPEAEERSHMDHPDFRVGATIITLENADEGNVRLALNLAWRNTSPKRLLT